MLPGEGGEEQDSAEAEISVYVFLDTDDSETIGKVTDSVDELVRALGYDGPHDVEIDTGSFIRRSSAWLRRTLTSEEAQELRIKAQRALELKALDKAQAEVDAQHSEAVSNLLNGLDGVERAAIRVGSPLAHQISRTSRRPQCAG